MIGSSHVMHGVDPYYPAYWENHSEEEGYREYFESILENIAAFDGFDVYGHIDYVVRYGPNKNANYSYQKYADIIDEILKALIIKGKGIEINTGGVEAVSNTDSAIRTRPRTSLSAIMNSAERSSRSVRTHISRSMSHLILKKFLLY